MLHARIVTLDVMAPVALFGKFFFLTKQGQNQRFIILEPSGIQTKQGIDENNY